MAYGRTLTLWTSALALVAGGSAVVLAADRFPAPEAGEPADVVATVAVPPAATTLVCPRQPVVADGAERFDADFEPVTAEPASAVAFASFPRQDGPAGAGVVVTAGAGRAFVGPQAGMFRSAGGQTTVARVEPAGRAPFAAGAALWRVDTGDLRGLWASPCPVPRTEAWLVGGSTALGRNAVLELTNPGETAVTATLSAWGPVGPITLPIQGTLTLAPGATEQVNLGVDLVEVDRFALRVSAAGGMVAATIADSALDGLTPGGVDAITPTAAPGTLLVIPGVQLPPEGADASGNLVRLVNPGDRPAAVRVELLAADGAVPIPGAEAVTVDPGAVAEVALTGLAAGDVAVRVSADAPVAAAVQLARTGRAEAGGADGAVDRAWAVATAPAASASVVLPQGVAQSARLMLANPTQRTATLRLTSWAADGVRGGVREVTLPPGASTALDAAEFGQPAAFTLAADQAVHAAALLTADAPDGTLLSVLPFTVDADVERTVAVRVSGS